MWKKPAFSTAPESIASCIWMHVAAKAFPKNLVQNDISVPR